jgi:CubicO group peptidase (beta-lactamase class C family)
VAFLVAAITASAQTFDRASPETLGLSSDRLSRLDAALAAYVDDEQYAGSVTLVLRDGQTAFFEAYGDRDRETQSPMTTDTIFRIASQSKAIVSTAAMILQEEGKLLIADPVGKYLPEFAETTVAVPRSGGGYDVVRASRPITIRDLLTHTSGFDYGQGVAADRWEAAGIQGYYFSDRDEPIRETVRRMAALPASAHPGTQWIYGYNIDILGAVVEVASDMPLDEFLEEKLFAPLGMVDTQFYLPRAERERLATVYAQVDGALERAPEDGSAGQGAFADGPQRSFSGGAGLLSTATDYARFLQMILNRGELDGARVLSPTTVELMSQDHLGDIAFRPGSGMGLGFSVLEDVGLRGTPGSVGELGWGGAYHTTYWIDPIEALVVVHLTQLIPAGDVDDQNKVRTLIYQAIVD